MKKLLLTTCLMFLLMVGCSSTVWYLEGATLEEAQALYNTITRDVLTSGPLIRSADMEYRVWRASLHDAGFRFVSSNTLPENIRFGYTNPKGYYNTTTDRYEHVFGPDIAGK